MKFIETLNYGSIVDLISQAKERICISLPGIDVELADALVRLKASAEIIVLLDNSEATIRSGYGEIEGIEELRKAGIRLKECTGNFVSFIILDDIGYFVFPQSRIFSAEPWA